MKRIGLAVLVLMMTFGVLGRVYATPAAGDLVVPGHSVGKVRLGAARATVHRLMGKPSASTRWKSGPRQDTWLGPKPPNDKDGIPAFERIFLHVIYRNNKVMQIEFNSPKFKTAGGISVGSSLAQFREKHKNLRVRAYSYIEPEGGGYIGYYYDDVSKGIAFTFGTQDSFDARTTPEMLRVHRAGTPVLPDPGGEPVKAGDEIPIRSGD